MDTYRRNAILEAASLLASRDQQLSLWTAAMHPKPDEPMLSPTETIYEFFDYWDMIERHGDDYTCVSRVKREAARDLIDRMVKLTEADLHQHPDMLIDSQAWREVRALAARFLLAWQNG